MNSTQKRRRNQENESSCDNPQRSRHRSGRRPNPKHRNKNEDSNAGLERPRGNQQPHRHPRRGRNNNRRNTQPERTASLSTESTASATTQLLLHWPDPTTHYIPITEEHRLLPALIYWGKTERGMMRDQPEFRLRKILKLLGSKSSGDKRNGKHRDEVTISLLQSLSLRRHHLKLLNPTLSMTALRLGSGDDILAAATLFEECVESHLKKMGVPYLNEEDQRRMHEESGSGTRQLLTPDFRIRDGHLVELRFGEGGNALVVADNEEGTNDKDRRAHAINWIEAKMFYGASSIPASTDNAVGTILPKARQYVNFYGPGAIIFMYGCGRELALELKRLGVVALDSRGLDLDRVIRHQVGWCGDRRGQVLF